MHASICTVWAFLSDYSIFEANKIGSVKCQIVEIFLRFIHLSVYKWNFCFHPVTWVTNVKFLWSIPSLKLEHYLIKTNKQKKAKQPKQSSKMSAFTYLKWRARVSNFVGLSKEAYKHSYKKQGSYWIRKAQQNQKGFGIFMWIKDLLRNSGEKYRSNAECWISGQILHCASAWVL